MSRLINFLITELQNIRYWKIESSTLIVAIIALAQPWAVAIYKNVLRRGKLEIYETGSPEIGYSLWGPTLAFYGTLRTRHRELFVESTHLDVKILNDVRRRRFDWIAFRPLTTVVGRVISEVELKLPAGFIILPSQPYQYNILFSETPIREQIQIILKGLRDVWTSYLTGSEKLARLWDKPGEAAAQQRAQIIRTLYVEFNAMPDCVEAIDKIRALNPWTSGHYEVSMTVRAARPNRKTRKAWILTISPDDENSFDTNAPQIVEAFCLDMFVQHYFFYPKYVRSNFFTRALMRRERTI